MTAQVRGEERREENRRKDGNGKRKRREERKWKEERQGKYCDGGQNRRNKLELQIRSRRLLGQE